VTAKTSRQSWRRGFILKRDCGGGLRDPERHNAIRRLRAVAKNESAKVLVEGEEQAVFQAGTGDSRGFRGFTPSPDAPPALLGGLPAPSPLRLAGVCTGMPLFSG
jgi:hypothetical protein